MKTGDVPLEPHVEQQLEELGRVDLLVGIPSYNTADTIAHVVRAAAAGLAKYFPHRTAVIVNCDGGSDDGTAEVVEKTELESPKAILTEPAAKDAAEQYGIEVVDFGIKKLGLPQSVTTAIFEIMRSH